MMNLRSYEQFGYGDTPHKKKEKKRVKYNILKIIRQLGKLRKLLIRNSWNFSGKQVLYTNWILIQF